MPRYFFHVQDGSSAPDTDGTELPDIYTAHCASINTTIPQTSPARAQVGPMLRR